MEINFSNFGTRGTTMDAGIGDVSRETTDASRAERPASNLEITTRAGGLVDAEPVAEVSDADLRRDDALGKLVNAAFDLPPPPMPSFVG